MDSSSETREAIPGTSVEAKELGCDELTISEDLPEAKKDCLREAKKQEQEGKRLAISPEDKVFVSFAELDELLKLIEEVKRRGEQGLENTYYAKSGWNMELGPWKNDSIFGKDDTPVEKRKDDTPVQKREDATILYSMCTTELPVGYAENPSKDTVIQRRPESPRIPKTIHIGSSETGGAIPGTAAEAKEFGCYELTKISEDLPEADKDSLREAEQEQEGKHIVISPEDNVYMSFAELDKIQKLIREIKRREEQVLEYRRNKILAKSGWNTELGLWKNDSIPGKDDTPVQKRKDDTSVQKKEDVTILYSPPDYCSAFSTAELPITYAENTFKYTVIQRHPESPGIPNCFHMDDSSETREAIPGTTTEAKEFGCDELTKISEDLPEAKKDGLREAMEQGQERKCHEILAKDTSFVRFRCFEELQEYLHELMKLEQEGKRNAVQNKLANLIRATEGKELRNSGYVSYMARFVLMKCVPILLYDVDDIIGRFYAIIESYLKKQTNVIDVVDLNDFVWWEGPPIQPANGRKAISFHMNFIAKLKCDDPIAKYELDDGCTKKRKLDGGSMACDNVLPVSSQSPLAKQQYFAEVIFYDCKNAQAEYELTSCVLLNQNGPSDNALDGIVYNKIRYASSELYIADKLHGQWAFHVKHDPLKRGNKNWKLALSCPTGLLFKPWYWNNT